MATNSEFLIHSTRPDGLSVVTKRAIELIDHPSFDYVQSQGIKGEPPSSTFYSGDDYVFGRSGWGEFQKSYAEETFYSLTRSSFIGIGEDPNRATPDVVGPSAFYMSRGHVWIENGSLSANLDSVVPGGGSDDNVADEDEAKIDFGTISSAHTSNLADVAVVDTPDMQRTVVFHHGGEFLVFIDRSLHGNSVEQAWHCGEGVTVETSDQGVDLLAGDAQAKLVWPLQQSSVSIDGSSITATTNEASNPLVTVLGTARRGILDALSAEVDADVVALKVQVGSVSYDLYISGTSVTDYDPRVVDEEEPAVQDDAFTTSSVAQVVADARGRLAGKTRNDVRSELLPELTNAYRQATRDGDRADNLASLLIDLAGDDDSCFSTRMRRTFPHRRDPFFAFTGESVLTPDSGRPWPLEWNDEPTALSLIAQGESVCSASSFGDLLIPWAAVSPGIAECLVVRLHGAMNRQQVSIPALPGLTSAVMANQPQLIIQDPSLDLDRDLRLGWYLGSDMTDGHVAVAEVIQKVATAQGTSNIIIQGNSGGGFAALHIASLIPGSIAVAHNPQTDLLRYHRHLTQPALNVCLGGDVDSSEALKRLSIAQRWEGRKVKAHILANTGDEFHVNEHVKPLQELAEANEEWDLDVQYFDWGPGHVPPPNADYRPGIDLALKDFGLID